MTEQEKGELALTLALLHGMRYIYEPTVKPNASGDRWYTSAGFLCPVLNAQRDRTGFYFFESLSGLALAYCEVHKIPLEPSDV